MNTIIDACPCEYCRALAAKRQALLDAESGLDSCGFATMGMPIRCRVLPVERWEPATAAVTMTRAFCRRDVLVTPGLSLDDQVLLNNALIKGGRYAATELHQS